VPGAHSRSSISRQIIRQFGALSPEAKQISGAHSAQHDEASLPNIASAPMRPSFLLVELNLTKTITQILMSILLKSLPSI
jgi:hypothetical protein